MKIAIAGCGIGGLTVAGFLADGPYDLTIFDQFETPAPVGSGLVIQPVGLRVLDHLGLAKEVLSKGAPGYRMIGHEAKTGRKVLDVSYGKTGGPNFGLGIHRASLFDVLLKSVIAKGVQITSDHVITGSKYVDGKRYLSFADQNDTGPFDLIIDATGSGSCLNLMQAKELAFGALWATVDWPAHTTLHYDMLQQQYRRAAHMIGVLPVGTLPGETTRKAALFWSLPVNGFEIWQANPLEEWKTQAIALWPELVPFIDQIQSHDQMTLARYTHGTLRKFYTNSMAFIGDAAHCASPQLGQGANMALLDAYALAECLKTLPVKQALFAYHNARKTHVRVYQTFSWMFTPMYQSNSRILPLLRDWILAPASQIPPFPQILTRLVRGNLVKPYSI